MFDLMVSKGCSPDIITLNTLIDGCCRAKRVDDGMKLLHEMSRRGLVPDTVSYSILFTGSVKWGMLMLLKTFSRR
jgi:pentatricopeptide repeat protein